MYRTLIESDLAWNADARKFKTPDDFLVSAMRASRIDVGARPDAVMSLLRQLGQPPFTPRSPAGFADTAADWTGPDALWKRVQAAQALASGAGTTADPLAPAQAMPSAVRSIPKQLPHSDAPSRRAMAWPCCSPAPPSSGEPDMSHDPTLVRRRAGRQFVSDALAGPRTR